MVIRMRLPNKLFVISVVLSLVANIFIAPSNDKNLSFGSRPSLENSSAFRKLECVLKQETIKSLSPARLAGYHANGQKEKQTGHSKDFNLGRISKVSIPASDAFLSEFKNHFVSPPFYAPFNKAPPLI